MNKTNNEIFAILLATLSIFIFLSLIQFNPEYEISDIYYLIIGQDSNIIFPLTGALGASISAYLKNIS